ncbi:sialate O-acetylesterase [Sphingobacterium siyangense]|uniref:Sialate O-acetylesterase n=1 Tax=Sphingobacterium siyangense TaxID=459529 RepID=A0A562MSB0_9SPHI|nr:sialate O-acetylesterase [Sphingobacterium siyangense]TWI22749.1 sialate O-acetylesterase [Sphingobacterium siyangense]
MKKILFSFILAGIAFSTQAKVTLPHVFGSNMVLQQGKPVVVWGHADPQEKIEVRLKGLIRKTVADQKGAWRVTFTAQKASFDAFTMEVKGDNTILLKNVVVGEVWLCSGQSNMEYTMQLHKGYKKPAVGVDRAEEELRQPGNPKIRLFLVAKKKGQQDDVETKGWEVADPNSLAQFSAPGYFFGKTLQQQLNVPVGLISSSWGGSRIEPWTPLEAYQNSSTFKQETRNGETNIEHAVAGEMYEAMIRPLAPFAMKGFIWYQGESNLMFEDARYYAKQKLLIDTWRKNWKDKNMPFYYVQIAPYYYSKRKDKTQHHVEALPWFWEIQTKCMNIKNSGMAVVTDLVDDLSDIHPSYKWEVGRRLALWPLAFDYGQKNIVFSGPQYKSKKIVGNNVILNFKHVGSGLQCKGDQLTWFEVAGADGKFVPAEAKIEGDHVVVSAASVRSPKQVRFGWHETARPNFFNKEGLPTLPFRTE